MEDIGTALPPSSTQKRKVNWWVFLYPVGVFAVVYGINHYINNSPSILSPIAVEDKESTSSSTGDYFASLVDKELKADQIIEIHDEIPNGGDFITIHLASLNETIGLEHMSWMEPTSFYKLEITDLSQTSSFDIETSGILWRNILVDEGTAAKTQKLTKTHIRDMEQFIKNVRSAKENTKNLLDQISIDYATTTAGNAGQYAQDYQMIIWISDDQIKIIQALIKTKYALLDGLKEGNIEKIIRADNDTAALAVVLSWYDKGVIAINAHLIAVRKGQDDLVKSFQDQIDQLGREIQNSQTEIASSSTSTP